MSASVRNLEHAAQVQFVRAEKAEQRAQDIQHALNHASIATTDLYIKRLAGVADKGARLLETRYSSLLLPDLSSPE